MGKNLVIVESPPKAKTISKILGKDYIVKSSMGHVRDLPVRTLGVDVENEFRPKYVLVKGRRKVVDELKNAAKECDVIYLAPDPDREGEAIAWHLKEILDSGKTKRQFWRVQYNEITPRAVRHAFEEPGELDEKRVNAQQARRILDRIVGYTVSPVLWRHIKRGLSAGRVQSVALRLVCEREEAIRSFVPEKFWIIGALARKLITPLDPFELKLTRIDGEKAEVKSEEHARQIRNDLEKTSLRVGDITRKEIRKRPQPPFITSTLQQAASSRLSYSPNRTMQIAQKLYEGVEIDGQQAGLITYMRTDSFAIANDARSVCKQYIETTYGADYYPEKPNMYKSKKNAQEAHEAIRPTDVKRTPDSLKSVLDPAGLRLYRLIWNRFVASQMAPAVIDQRTVKVDAVPESGEVRYVLQASASDIKFPGYMKVSGKEQESKEKKDGDKEGKLPPLTKDEPLVCIEWLSEEKETQPPSRFSEASLVRELESNGVGRPSTYAQTISTLCNRNYVDREKRTLIPTDLGMEVNALLVRDLGMLFDVGFTAKMESLLDDVEDGKTEWTVMLSNFYEKFKTWMEGVKTDSADPEEVWKVVNLVENVTDWAPEVKRGERTYSDHNFVSSIREQLEKGEKGVSPRQYKALLGIACRYRDQLPQLESVLKEIGREDVLTDPSLKPPKDTTMRKLQLLESVSMDDSAKKFVSSLRSRAEGGRCLSPAQVRALNNVVHSHSGQIEGFDEIRESLDIQASEVEEDKESKPLIDAMSSVHSWKQPVRHGKRVFDDKAFCESLTDYFARKGFLSVRQRAALKKMVRRYRDQIPDYAALEKELGLDKIPARGGKRRLRNQKRGKIRL